LPAPCLAADPLRGHPAPARNRAPLGQGPFEPSPRATCRPAAAASLAKGRPPLGRMPEQAETRSSGRTIRSVTRPLGRPAFRQVHQRNNPVTGRSDPLLSQQKRRLDRLSSRPQPTSAVAIARQRIWETARSGSFRPALPVSPPAGVASSSLAAEPSVTGGDGSVALTILPSLAPSPRCLQARYRSRSSTKLQHQRVCVPATSFRPRRRRSNGVIRYRK